MKVLILGSKGNLAQASLKVYKDTDVTGWDRDELDIGDEAQVLKKISELKPNVVINCAAYNAVDKAEEDYANAELVNGYAAGFVAGACKQIGAKLIHYSTGQVFDGKLKDGYNEDALPNPINAYGKSKLLGETEIEKNTDQFYIIRTAWLYGHLSNGKKSFIDIMLDLAKKDEPVKAVGDEFGAPTYVYDLAQASRALIEDRKPFGIYHLVNSGLASRFDWAQEIFRIKNLKVNLLQVPASEFPRRPAARPKYEILNNTKFIKLRPWAEALEEFLKS